jgi:hypothetical protein
VHTTDELIFSIVNRSQLPSSKRRRDVEQELRAHAEDFADTTRKAGHPEHEIDGLLLDRIGDPEQIAADFSHVYRYERRCLSTLAYSLSTLLLAASLVITILVAQAGLAFGFGSPISTIVASRYTVIEGLDILACVAVYLGLVLLEDLFRFHRFQKAASLIIGITALLFGTGTAMGLHPFFLTYGMIGGIICRAVQLFISTQFARTITVLICSVLAGLCFCQLFGKAHSAGYFAALRSPVSPPDLIATLASWLVLGAAYALMSHFASSVDKAIVNRLQRI